MIFPLSDLLTLLSFFYSFKCVLKEFLSHNKQFIAKSQHNLKIKQLKDTTTHRHNIHRHNTHRHNTIATIFKDTIFKDTTTHRHTIHRHNNS